MLSFNIRNYMVCNNAKTSSQTHDPNLFSPNYMSGWYHENTQKDKKFYEEIVLLSVSDQQLPCTCTGDTSETAYSPYCNVRRPS